MSKYIYDENYEKFNIEDALTITKCKWADGNPNGENRVGLFVASGNNVNEVVIADSDSYVCGVTVENDTFLGTDKDNPEYCVVQSLGVCTVRDITGTILAGGQRLIAGDKCMPASDGTAVKSSNDLGYTVVGRIDLVSVQIVMSPNNDMIQRIKVDVNDMQKTLTTPFNFKGTVATSSELPSSASVNDTYYVQDLKYRVTWNGSAWKQSSLDESDYEDELSELNQQIEEAIKRTEEVSEDIDEIYDNLCNSGTVLTLDETVTKTSEIEQACNLVKGVCYKVILNDGTYDATLYFMNGNDNIATLEVEKGEETRFILPDDAYSIILQMNYEYTGQVYLFISKVTISDLYDNLKYKQDILVSGQNIKTVNGKSLLGEGNIVIEGGGGGSGVTIATELPTASEEYRGNIYLITKDVSDELYICMKRNGTYKWVPFTAVDPETGDNAILGTAILGTMILGKGV